MFLEIKEEYKAEIIDPNNERLEINSQAQSDLIKTLSEVLDENHGIDFYKGLIESINEYSKLNKNIDIYEIIVELEQEIVNQSKISDTKQNTGKLDGVFLNLENETLLDVKENPINKFIENEYENTVDMFIAKKEDIKENGYKKVTWSKKKPFNDYAVLQVGEEEIRVAANLYESVNHILGQLSVEYKESNNKLISDMVADFERTYYKTDGLTLGEQERNLTDTIENGIFVKKPEHDYYYKFFINQLEKTPYFVQTKMENYLDKAIKKDEIYKYYPLKDITTRQNEGFEVIMNKEDSGGEDNVVKTPEKLINLLIEYARDEVYDYADKYNKVWENDDNEDKYNVIENGSLASFDTPYELLDILLLNNSKSLILSEENEIQFERYFATKNEELLNNFSNEVIDKYKMMEKLKFKNGFNLQLQIIDYLKNNLEISFNDVQETFGLSTNEIIENINDNEEISSIIHVTVNDETKEYEIKYDESYYKAYEVVKQSLKNNLISSEVDKNYLSKQGIISSYINGNYRIGEDLLIDEVYSQINKEYLKKELIIRGDSGEIWDNIENTIFNIMEKEEDIILNEDEYDKWISDRDELNKFSEKIHQRLWNEINEEIYNKIDTYMEKTIPNNNLNPTMVGYIEFPKYYPVELISSRLEHWYLKNTGRTLSEFDNIQADELLIPELYMNTDDKDKNFIEIKPISLNEYIEITGGPNNFNEYDGIKIHAHTTAKNTIKISMIQSLLDKNPSENLYFKYVFNQVVHEVQKLKADTYVINDKESREEFLNHYELEFKDIKDTKVYRKYLNQSKITLGEYANNTKRIFKKYGLDKLNEAINESGYVQNFKSEGSFDPSEKILATFNSNIIEDYISVSKVINTKENAVITKLFDSIEGQELSNVIDSVSFIEDLEDELGVKIDFNELKNMTRKSKEVFWTSGEDILLTTNKLVNYKLVDEYLTNFEEFNFEKTLNEANEYYENWHVDELSKNETIDQYLRTTIEDVYTPKYIYERQFDEALSKFSAGNILVNEYETLKSEKRVGSILENYNNDIFDGSKFDNISGISETNEEIIIKRDNGNPFNWEMKVIFKDLSKENLKLVSRPIEYDEDEISKELFVDIKYDFSEKNYKMLWNKQKEEYNNFALSKADILLINENNEVVDYLRGDHLNYEKMPPFKELYIDKDYQNENSSIGQILIDKTQKYQEDILELSIDRFENILEEEKLVDKISNTIDKEDYLKVKNSITGEGHWQYVEDKLFDYLQDEQLDKFINYDNEEIEDKFIDYLFSSDKLNDFIDKVHKKLDSEDINITDESKEAIYLEFIESHNSREHVEKWIDKPLTQDDLEDFKADLIKHSSDKDMGYYKAYIEKTNENGEVINKERFDLNNERFETIRLIEYVEENLPSYESIMDQYEEENANVNEKLDYYLNYISEEKQNNVIDMIKSVPSFGGSFNEFEGENLQKFTELNNDEKVVFKEMLDIQGIEHKLNLPISRSIDSMTENEINKLKDIELSDETKDKLSKKEEEINKRKNKKLIVEEQIEMD